MGVEFSICLLSEFHKKKKLNLICKLNWGQRPSFWTAGQKSLFGETKPEGLHLTGPGGGSTGLLGEGDASPSTTCFPALRYACVFWRKKKGYFPRTGALQARSHQLRGT